MGVLDVLNEKQPRAETVLGILGDDSVMVKPHVRRPRGKVNMFDQMAQTTQAMPGYQQEALKVAKPAIDLLPAIGSMAGPVGAGVGAIARQALSTEAPQPLSGAIAGVKPGSLLSRALDVVEQASLAKLGTKIGPGIKVRGRTIIPGLESVGRGVMRMSLGLTTPQARTAIKAGFTVAEKKLDALLNRIGAIGERQMDILRQAPPTSVFQTRDLAQYIDRVLIQPAKRNMKSGDTVAKLQKWTEEMLLDHPSGQMTAQELHTAAQLARQEAAPIMEKAGKGIQVTQRDPWEQK